MGAVMTIPPVALEAGAMAAYEERCRRISHGRFPSWEQLDQTWKDDHRAEARAAFLTMLEAWPGMHQRTGIKQHESGEWREPYPMLCLPLPPQEARAALGEERT